MRALLLLLIMLYQKLISPLLGSHCRFYPTCSEYTKQALNSKGILIGLLLSCKRIVRCHPFCSGGYDPLPGEEK